MTELPRMGRVTRIHFVGIGGVGMCGIAEVLANDGYQVSGSDCAPSLVIERLRSLGITVVIGHDKSHVLQADVVVQSTAVTDDNPEIAAAKANKITVIPRALMLAELMRFKLGIAVAGTHGKTTTTSLLSSILDEGGLEPSFIIGGKLNSLGATAKLGQSSYMVVEADESDASFLHLQPSMAIVTNIDADHMGTYNQDLKKLHQTFLEFLHHLPFYGLAVVCLDDEGVQAVLKDIKRPIKTYGFHPDADICARDYQQQGLISSFVVVQKGQPDMALRCSLPGRHNVQNALAAITIALELGVEWPAIKSALAKFEGVGRRFQLHGEQNFHYGRALLIDDYGHHPREIESTIDAARKVWPEKRIVLAFQPHRYSRTAALFDDFVTALSAVDALILLEVFPAGETLIEGATHLNLADSLQERCPTLTIKVASINTLAQALDEVVHAGDIVLTQGAGNIGQQALTLINRDCSDEKVC